MSEILLRKAIQEILLNESDDKRPARYTPSGIWQFQFNQGFEGEPEKFEDSYYFGSFIVRNFFSADSENEVIIELNANNADDFSNAKQLGANPVPPKYLTNTTSKFYKELKNEFRTQEALDRAIEIIKNVKDDASLRDSKSYNHSLRFFVITSSTNSNFTYKGGDTVPTFSAELGSLFKEIVADPLKGYGIYITKMPEPAQKEVLWYLNGLQTSLSILSFVPGYGKIAFAANLGPSLALASYYAAIHKNIDPNSKVTLPIINTDVSARSLNAFTVGAYSLGGLIGCFSAFHQLITELKLLSRLNQLTGIEQLAGSNPIKVYTDVINAYKALGNAKLASTFTSSTGEVASIASPGWQKLSEGFVYVTGTGSNWFNSITRAGIIADKSGKAVVFSAMEVKLINYLLSINGNYNLLNYYLIGKQIEAIASSAGSIMTYVGIGMEILGTVMDGYALEDILSKLPDTKDSDNNSIINDPVALNQEVSTMMSTVLAATKEKLNIKVVNGKTDWSSYLPQSGYTTIVDISNNSKKIVSQISINAQKIINPRQGVTNYFPQIILVDSPIYKSFEIMSKLPGSFYPPRNYFYRCNDTGSVFLVLTKESAIAG